MASPETTNPKEEMISNDGLIKFFQEEYNWTFAGPFYTQAEIPEVREEYMEKGDITAELGYLRDQLLSYVIADQFDKNHTGRRIFWDKIREQKGEGFVKKIQNLSKLRGANLTSSSWAMQSIIRKLGKQGYLEIAQELEKILDLKALKGGDEYAEMDFDEKVAYAREFDARIHKFLKILS